MPTRTIAFERRRLLHLAGLATLASASAGCAPASLTGEARAHDETLDMGRSFLSSNEVHALEIGMTPDQFRAAVAAYEASGAKKWIECPVRIDATTYEQCGVRFKGNSTLWRVRDTATATASDYPWLVRLDKYIDGQTHEGVPEIAVRANNTASALNEALTLDLLGRSGLAAQGWAYATVGVAGAEAALRLLLENPSDAWARATFGVDGMLYKAEATANYDYLGDDSALYADRFDQEAGVTDLTPLIAFLKWANGSSDNDFRASLPKHLDGDAFATYLAFEDLVDNYDAIDGPGNNSYLFYDPGKARMTVVAWDHNLTFGVTNRPAGRGGGGGPMGAERGPMAAAGGGPPGRRGNQTGNVLARRFRDSAAYAAQIGSESAQLRAELIANGYAASRLDALAALVAGSTFVDAATLANEKVSIAAYLTANP